MKENLLIMTRSYMKTQGEQVTFLAKQSDCSISTGGSSGHVGINHNLGWVGVDPYNSLTYANFFDKIRPSDQETLEEEAENIGATKIETLPLFPMHGEDIHGYCNLKSNLYNYDGND
ncbi:hypothetical protein JHK85_025716 [Glycine max]|nr:hypothetical protein JHK85_025716 [Glycine max]